MNFPCHSLFFISRASGKEIGLIYFLWGSSVLSKYVMQMWHSFFSAAMNIPLCDLQVLQGWFSQQYSVSNWVSAKGGQEQLCSVPVDYLFLFFFSSLSLLNEKFQTYFPPCRKWLCWHPSPLNILNASMAKRRYHLPRTLLLNTVKFYKQPLILQIK